MQWVGFRVASQRDDEDVDAKHEHPHREDDLEPRHEAGRDEEHDSGCVAVQREPAGHKAESEKSDVVEIVNTAAIRIA